MLSIEKITQIFNMSLRGKTISLSNIKYIVMKNWGLYLMILAPIVTWGQSSKDDIQKLWKEIDTQAENYEVKSLSPKVKQVLDLSKKYKDYPSFVKAMFYQAKIDITTKDDSEFDVNQIFKEFEAERKTAKGALAAILDAYVAKLYKIYFQENAFKIKNRTEIASDGSDDVRFMSTVQLKNLIDTYYQKAIKGAKQFPNEEIKEWGDIFLYDKGGQLTFEELTLYQALSLDYADVLLNTPYFLNEFSEQNTQEGYLLLEEIKREVDTENKKALATYIELYELSIRSDWSDKEKKEKYLALIKRFPNNIKAKQAYVSFANQLAKSDEWNEDGQLVDYNEILEVINEVLHTTHYKLTADERTFFDTYKKNIINPMLTSVGFMYSDVQSSIPLVIEYKNLQKVYVKVLTYEGSSARAEFDFTTKEEGNYERIITQAKEIDTFEIDLKPTADHRTYSSHIALKPLNTGRYVVLLSSAPFDQIVKGVDVVTSVITSVSPYAIVFDQDVLRVYERESGALVANKKVVVTSQVNDKRDRNFWTKTLVTNKQGEASIILDNKTSSRAYSIEGEQVYYYNYFYERNRNKPIANDVVAAQIFTDRAIYRPGQHVYFKAIVTETKDKVERILPNLDLEVELFDANRNLVAKQPVRTNEFGSVQGSFNLPTSGRLGSFFIAIKNVGGSKFISVEEYKRPKFAVEMDKVSKAFTLDEQVKVSGKAIAFSGANIADAQVRYTVSRTNNFIFLPWYRNIYTMKQTEEVVAQGEKVTDQEGKFVIDFLAKPGDSLKENDEPRIFNYRVDVEVIDQNGEAHNAFTVLTIGDVEAKVMIDLPAIVTQEELKKMIVKTMTLNDEKYEAKGTLSLSPLIAPYPKRILNSNSRYLGKASEETYTYEEFVKLFPYLPYGNELDQSLWKEGGQVFTTGFDTAISNEVIWDSANEVESGMYIVKATIYDQNGRKIEQTKKIEVDNTGLKNRKVYDLLVVNSVKSSYAPGEKASFTMLSGEANTIVTVRLMYEGEVVKKEIVEVGKKEKQISFTLKDLGRYEVVFEVVKHNFAQSKAFDLLVEDKVDKIEVILETFRDKLKPGQKETWSMKVSGKNKDAVVAEILAGMYDASLDEFEKNDFSAAFNVKPTLYNHRRFDFENQFNRQYHAVEVVGNYLQTVYNYINFPVKLNLFNLSFNQAPIRVRGMAMYKNASAPLAMQSDMNSNMLMEKNEVFDEAIVESATSKTGGEADVQVRTNLQETAFFYPQLKTDEEGNVVFEFTMPEALTKWKFMALAHTKDLKTATVTKYVQTQKELMVVPNVPRFLREGDKVTIAAKTVNMTDKAVEGSVSLLLFDAFSMKPMDAAFENVANVKPLTIGANTSVSSSWTITVPKGVQAVVYRVVAKTAEFSDGEEAALPIVSNRMLVTESLPVFVKEGQSKTFTLKDYLVGTSSKEDYRLTFEFTANPIWNAIFALPSLKEYRFVNSDAQFAKFYANAVATSLMNSDPKIKRVFDQWNQKGMLISKLEQNEELKNILLEETPWLLAANNEEEQMKKLAVLFDLNKMQLDRKEAFAKLAEMQNADGGFAWFPGGNSSEYITESIVTGFGMLKQMNILNADLAVDYTGMLQRAIQYIDQANYKNYQNRLKNQKPAVSYSYNNMHYFYARSFFKEDYAVREEYAPMYTEFIKALNEKKDYSSLFETATSAIIAKRFGQVKTAERMVKAMLERAVSSEEMGMYWKENTAGWVWYQAPIETQVLVMEAVNEVKGSQDKAIEEMKVWLLKNKQTTNWGSTKATTRAIAGLLQYGKPWVSSEKGVEVKVGKQPIDLTKDAQMGTGYVKQVWSKNEMTKDQGTVEVTKTSPGVAWGALYYQYFEDLDKVKSASTGISFAKRLFVRTKTAQGDVLKPITENDPIKVGDIVTVRLEMTVDRDMDYVHLKDMRASGFEPLNVFSGYRWRGEFSYYEETRDVATNFFISHLRKGSYVFEYDLRANTAGNFSNGITTLQSLYAPEMSAHSEGIRIDIKQ